MCVRCDDPAVKARGLCYRCYNTLRSQDYATFLQYPARNRTIDYPTAGDPLIIWFFEELKRQKISLMSAAFRAGISQSSTSRLKTKLEIRFSYFQALLGALGYELKIVKKETSNA